MEAAAAAAMQEGQGEAPDFRRTRSRPTDASSTLAMMHDDTADTDSETEAVQEAATVPGEAGFGAENELPMHASVARETSVVSNETTGGPAGTGDDASLVQGAAHSAFAGAGGAQQAISEVQGGAAGATAEAPTPPGEAHAEIQSSGPPAAFAFPALSGPANSGPAPSGNMPLDAPSAAAQLAGALSIADRTGSFGAAVAGVAQPAASENASALFGEIPAVNQGAEAARGHGGARPVAQAESVGMPAAAVSVGMTMPQNQPPRRELQPGFSITSNAGPHRGGPLQRRGPVLGEAASRPPPAPRRAASADGRAAASTDAQIGSVAPGREVAAADDAAATFSVSAAHSEDSQAGSAGPSRQGGDTPRGPSTANLSGLCERQPAAARPDQSAVSGLSPPAVNQTRSNGADSAAAGGGKSNSRGQIQSRKRKRPPQPAEEIAFEVRDAARDRDPLGALAAYDRGIAEGIALRPDTYASVLYLCAGGDSWETRARLNAGNAGPGSGAAAAPANSAAVTGAGPALNGPGEAVDYQMLFQRGREVFESMKSKGLQLTETAYTALARMAASAGDGNAALAAAQAMVESGVPPRLRSFAPALVAFSIAGQVDKAFEVSTTLAGLGLDLTEAEFAALLHVCQYDSSWDRTDALLRRIGRELTTLEQSTLAAARAVFASGAAAAALGEGGPLAGRGTRWEISEATVDPTGLNSVTGEHLAAFDLDDSEWGAFAAGIARLATEQEKRAHDFENFQRWLDAHGPFCTIIDGANLALFGQNFADGGFDFRQIDAAYKHATTAHPDLKPLVVLHAGRVKGPKATEPHAAALLNEWRASKTFYATPFGSNDDWYWMYAAVKAGRDGKLISNDEMRDHIFQLLAPKFFFKWKQRHQLKYGFGYGREFKTELPPPFSTALQQLPSGAWMFPSAAGGWLCAAPL